MHAVNLVFKRIVIMILMLAASSAAISAADLTEAEIENIARRSYPYVAMYNVNNKIALDPGNALSSGGWNRVAANTTLTDHNLQIIARPNNDTLYALAMLDLSQGPMIVSAPAFDSRYVSVMATGYDHYVNVLMSTRLGAFAEPSTLLFHTQRTPGYSGEPVEGIDRVVEMTGDFVSVLYRVMPHANEPQRMEGNIEAMQRIRAMSLSEFVSGKASAYNPPQMPKFQPTDFDVFENNLLEVMQFVFNHTTFDPDNEIDQAVLEAYAPLGIVPGREYDPAAVVRIDGSRFRAAAQKVAAEAVAMARDPVMQAELGTQAFLPKGEIQFKVLVAQSVIGPIGLPAQEAVYPPIATANGKPMNAANRYVIRMTRDELPPTTAFWSITLYDSENGFFMPNEHRKYSVGENTGYRLDDDGGIAIYLSAEKPQGVPNENWLPVAPGDYEMDAILRIYAPDLERFANWAPPRAERLD